MCVYAYRCRYTQAPISRDSPHRWRVAARKYSWPEREPRVNPRVNPIYTHLYSIYLLLRERVHERETSRE